VSGDDPLARPVWSALNTGWAHLAEGDARARRLSRDHGVFGAAANWAPQSIAALAGLVPPDGELWLAESLDWPVPPGTQVKKTAACVQMVADGITPAPDPDFAIVPLGEGDAAEMFALARLTEPGPYEALTHQLGRFIGVKVDGRLVAMAGERMAMPGYREVSGVCTHPDHRGRGYAGALMRAVARAMLARGETPFLHAYAANSGAIALYESLGFRVRRTVTATILVRDINI
jgi:predicted GNAT family acetyltransferase